eukprot:snap_masked-scaffold_63-processed-gene-0.42-mRNA-1 protein AED:1.00 eAED:1.00 QI:0/-1/0/0/-1/1/1/0/151
MNCFPSRQKSKAKQCQNPRYTNKNPSVKDSPPLFETRTHLDPFDELIQNKSSFSLFKRRPSSSKSKSYSFFNLFGKDEEEEDLPRKEKYVSAEYRDGDAMYELLMGFEWKNGKETKVPKKKEIIEEDNELEEIFKEAERLDYKYLEDYLFD